MRAVVQRALSASVSVDGVKISEIGKGLVVFIGFAGSDTENSMKYILEKTVGLRIFEDSEGKMNLSVCGTGGKILFIPNFTLYGDARKGKRPSFSQSAPPLNAAGLFEAFKKLAANVGVETFFGMFQADMQVNVVNDGPVTLLLDSEKLF